MVVNKMNKVSSLCVYRQELRVDKLIQEYNQAMRETNIEKARELQEKLVEIYANSSKM